MMRGLGSTWRSRDSHTILLAPSPACVPDTFRNVDSNPDHHERLLAQLQRLRGRVYLHDGAIDATQLSAEGRHMLDVDDLSWHVLSVSRDGRVTGCARYRVHEPDVEPEHLGAWSAPLARRGPWQWAVRMVFNREIELARRRNVSYVEVGGWAIADELRFSPQAADIALSTYALAQHLGGCVGITTATVRHCSSRILRKIGGQPLDFAAGPLPTYYDPRYRCEMELLRFDSHAVNPKYQAQLHRIAARFLDLPVICATRSVVWTGVPMPAATEDLVAAVA